MAIGIGGLEHAGFMLPLCDGLRGWRSFFVSASSADLRPQL
jgi:hypothetical protein